MTEQHYLKTPEGLYFEDFYIGQTLKHGVPRTITTGDCSMYTALTGSRFALHCADPVAQKLGFRTTPVDNFLVFHIAFGKTVNDISLNAVANLGYAQCRFIECVYPGDTLSVSSDVIGLKENSNGKTGVVYVHSKAYNQKRQLVLEFKRWVMVHKRHAGFTRQENVIPELADNVELTQQIIPRQLDLTLWPNHVSDQQRRASEFEVGDCIFHRDGITINDSDHSLATRLYQNNARVHFDQHLMQHSKHGKCLVYGGHIISLCRALSYNGMGNAIWLSAIHSGSHVNPCFAGDTIYTQSQVLAINSLAHRDDLRLVTVRMLGIKNNIPEQMSWLSQQSEQGRQYHPDVVLDMRLSYLMPR
ncbi:MaoC family dehydratase [Thalassotalea maritima]|uniref:MaoC family dehydratase n=1 Tax=Thalassotalea maritima TaxID=3242416 RepID=UPI0035282889